MICSWVNVIIVAKITTSQLSSDMQMSHFIGNLLFNQRAKYFSLGVQVLVYFMLAKGSVTIDSEYIPNIQTQARCVSNILFAIMLHLPLGQSMSSTDWLGCDFFYAVSSIFMSFNIGKK